MKNEIFFDLKKFCQEQIELHKAYLKEAKMFGGVNCRGVAVEIGSIETYEEIIKKIEEMSVNRIDSRSEKISRD